MYWGWWGSWWWWVGVAVLILFLLWWLFVWWPGWRRPRRPGGGYGPDQETPEGRDRARQILDERYARGEITREQYEEMRRDLDNRNAA